MKKILILSLFVVASLCGIQNIYAQPSVCVVEPYIEVQDEGAQACVEFVVNDFTDLTSMSFDIVFDEDKIEYTSLSVAGPAAGLSGFDNPSNSFDLTDIANGVVGFSWTDAVIGPDDGETLPDGTVLFQMCFTTVDDLGFSEIDIVEDKVTRDISGNFNIGFDFVKDGWIQIGESPIVVTIPTVSGLQGETVCMNFTIENFTEVLSTQMSINYDPAALTNPNASGINPMSGGFFDFAYPSPGAIVVLWTDVDGQDGVTLEDGSSFVQVCFDLVGDCTTFNPVTITDNPTITEAVTVTSSQIDIGDPTVGVFSNATGGVTIDCVQPGAPSFCIPDISDICPGESFTMDVTAQDFDNIRRMDFSINWNPSVLQIDNIIETAALPNFNINANQAGGFATSNWQSGFFGNSLNDGEVVFTLEFTVVGGGGSSSTVSITGNPTEIFFTDQSGANPDHIGYNSCNALFQACSPTGITVSADDVTADPGAPFCVDVTVQDFDDITQLTFPINFDPSVADFVEVTNFNLPGLSAADFNLSGTNFGLMCLDNWTSSEGVSLPDGSTIFSICFEGEDNPLACGDLFFTGGQCEQSVNQEGVGFEIDMNSNPGEICLSNPATFITSMSSTGGVTGSFVCVDIAVENFQNLGEMTYSLNWNPTVLEFLEVQNAANLTNLNSSSFDDTDADNGNLSVSWSAPGNTGVTLDDGTEIYSVCFQIIGDLSGCTPVSFSANPTAINIENANSPANLGMESSDGQVCELQALLSSAEITPVSCTSAAVCDGAIDITITGGNGAYVYEWTGPGITTATANNEDQTDLCVGTYLMQVTDATSGLVLEETYTVEPDPAGSFAVIGADTTLQCGNPVLNLDVSNNGTSVGDDFTYYWYGEGNVVVNPVTENSLTPSIGGCGDNVYLEVTNTATGCTVTDEMFIGCPSSPTIFAGDDVNYDCNSETVELDGTDSSMGDDISVLWTAEDGGAIMAGDETSYTPEVLSPGTYIFTIINNFNNCPNVDTVLVVDVRAEPLAVAAVDGSLDCDSDFVTLDGTGSDTGDFSYEWQTPAQATINTGSLTATTEETGWHYFVVTNNATGCSGVDSVLVNMEDGLPMVNPGENVNWFCDTENVTLTGVAPTEPGDYSYQWTGPGNITDATTLTPTVDAFGTYFLTVLNNATACDAIASVQVVDMTEPPLAEAGENQEINCAVAQVQLDATDSQEDNRTYMWTNANGTADGIMPGTETSLTPTITAVGVYVLEVTNTVTNCTATDQVEVVQGPENPVAVIVDNGDFFNCEVDLITLDASGSTTGVNYEYTWSGGCIDDLSDVANPVISCAGTYNLIVTDTVLNCVSEVAAITVNENIALPTIVTDSEVFISCGETTVMLDASQSSSGDDFMVTWVVIPGDPMGSIVSGENTLTPVVTEGTYGLTILNTLTQCDNELAVVVIGNSIAADAGMDVEIPCEGGSVMLDGTGSSEGVSYSWTINGGTDGIDNPDSATPTVSAPGEYILTVTDADGCTATDMVQVIGADAPIANAGDDMPFACADTSVTLDGSASDAGEGITYEWTTTDGSILSTDITQNTIEVNAVGTYLLTVTGADGCSSTDEVIVFSNNGDLPAAGPIDVEHDICESTANLSANLPEGTTGLWSASSNAVTFVSESEPATAVENIPGGEVLLIWTLSTENCPNYDADTVLVVTEYTPDALNDNAELTMGQEEITLDLFENDNTANVQSFTFNLEEPSIGTISENEGDGVITYTAEPGIAGAATFSYTLCNTNCPTLCDDATVTILLDGEINLENLPNAITPNGDGLNDVLIFDILNSGNYPNNSLTIFNRWGDEVFSRSPYWNDWGGTKNGKLLPQATYYYVLRLDLGEGEVIKGDITILK